MPAELLLLQLASLDFRGRSRNITPYTRISCIHLSFKLQYFYPTYTARVIWKLAKTVSNGSNFNVQTELDRLCNADSNAAETPQNIYIEIESPIPTIFKE